MENFAAIDFETANQCRSSVCSVGVVVVRNGRITDTFYSLIYPRPAFFTYWTTQVHGLTMRDVKNAPPFPEVWEKVAPMIAGLPLVAHNSPFDESCLKAVFSEYGMYYPGYRFHCTCRASRSLLRDVLSNHQLQTVAAYCGYDLTNHHHALADAEACAWIARKLLKDERPAGAHCIAVGGSLTPYPEGYGRELWRKVLMPHLRKNAYGDNKTSGQTDMDET